jgi:hypothetical protein
VFLIENAERWIAECCDRMTMSDESRTDIRRDQLGRLVEDRVDEGHLWTFVGMDLERGQQFSLEEVLVVIEIHLNYN